MQRNVVGTRCFVCMRHKLGGIINGWIVVIIITDTIGIWYVSKSLFQGGAIDQGIPKGQGKRSRDGGYFIISRLDLYRSKFH